VITQISPTDILPDKFIIIVFPATNPVNVPLPLVLDIPAKLKLPFSCPPVVVPERLILVTKLRVVRIAVPLNVAPVWLGKLKAAEKPRVPLFRRF
jgi:hypothetical protein